MFKPCGSLGLKLCTWHFQVNCAKTWWKLAKNCQKHVFCRCLFLGFHSVVFFTRYPLCSLHNALHLQWWLCVSFSRQSRHFRFKMVFSSNPVSTNHINRYVVSQHFRRVSRSCASVDIDKQSCVWYRHICMEKSSVHSQIQVFFCIPGTDRRWSGGKA